MDRGALLDRFAPMFGGLVAAHVAVYRATGGLLGHRVPGLPAMLLLDHVGARSGRLRTTPLLYVDASPVTGSDALAIVASYGGHPRHPAWFHNLRAHPDTTLQVRDEVRPVHARVAPEDERARLWSIARAAYPGFDDYERHADGAGRTIPVVVLTRRER